MVITNPWDDNDEEGLDSGRVSSTGDLTVDGEEEAEKLLKKEEEKERMELDEEEVRENEDGDEDKDEEHYDSDCDEYNDRGLELSVD